MTPLFHEAYPVLGRLWQLKEELRQLYELGSKLRASYRLDKIIQGYRQVPSGYAQDFARTFALAR